MWFSLSADYFNENISQFEPLIEHWPCHVKMNNIQNPKMAIEVISKETMNIKFAVLFLFQPWLKKKKKRKLDIHRSDINVSHAFINTLGAIMEILQKDYKVTDSAALQTAEEYSPYWIINDTGVKMTVWPEEVMHKVD